MTPSHQATRDGAAGQAATLPAPVHANVFVGRQPIFDLQEEVFGYELLFRSNDYENSFGVNDADRASCQTISNTLNVMGLNALSNGRKTFINITRHLLTKRLYAVLPPQETVLELLETVEPDPEVIRACRELREAGYQLALDDFILRPDYEPLLEIADYVKIDFLNTRAEERLNVTSRLNGRRAALLAEKVEIREDFQMALDLGYAYFQGYFFCKPEIIRGCELPPMKHNYVRFLAEVMRPHLDLDAVEQIVKYEPSLSMKLLRYLNSSGFGLRSKVQSIRQALALLGERPLKQWASVMALCELSHEKPTELLTLCLVRARFSEMLATLVTRGRELDYFLLGLLSVLEAVTDQPLDETLAGMPIADDVKGALLGRRNALAPVLGLAIACERGNVEIVEFLSRKLALPTDQILGTHCQALIWADRVFAEL